MVYQVTFSYSSDLSQVNLAVSFDSSPSDTLPMFVFIKGALSGIVPGVIAVSSQEEVPVEIGVVQLNRSPLYTFKFGQEALKNRKVEVVTTNIGSASDLKAKFLTLHKDIVKTVELVSIKDNLYSIKLPTTAYLEIAKFKNDNKEFGALPVKKAEDYGYSPHLVYDKVDEKTIYMGNVDSWSGANMIALTTGGIGYKSEKQKWTINSNPPGADIYTDAYLAPVGKTKSTVDIVKSISSYVILKMDGYTQCIIQMDEYRQCTPRDCTKNEGGDGSVSLTCNLKKVQ